MNTPASVAPAVAPLVEVKHTLAPTGDPMRFAIQSDLYYTQFYKGRTDGLPDPERMDAAIKLVQIAAHLPVTGIFNDDVHDAIVRYRRTRDFRATEPPSTTMTTSPPITATPSRSRSLIRDLATFAILTSPAWGFLLLIQRPWTKLRVGARG